MDLQPFLIRLLIGVLIIWLIEYILGVVSIDAQVKRIITAIVVIVMVLYIIFGSIIIH